MSHVELRAVRPMQHKRHNGLHPDNLIPEPLGSKTVSIRSCPKHNKPLFTKSRVEYLPGLDLTATAESRACIVLRENTLSAEANREKEIQITIYLDIKSLSKTLA